jgi:transcriptional regulator with XRE-family HTH domain
MLVGQKIKKLRELKNLTQEHVANELGITQSAYSKIENNEVELVYSKLEQIANVLGLSPEDIITFNEHVVFNIMHNKDSQNGMIVHHASAIEKHLYEEQISQLKEENTYLKSVLDKILLSENKGK